MKIIVLLAIAFCGANALPYAAMGMFGGALNGHGMNHPGMDMMGDIEEDTLMLNCLSSFKDGQGNVLNKLTVNIESKGDDRSQHNMHGMMGYGSMYGYGVGPSQGQKKSLKARIEVVSNVAGGTGYVVFTSRGRPQDGCKAENFGDVLTEALGSQHSAHGGMGLASSLGYGGYGYGGYGYDAYGYGMGLGYGSVNGMGLGYGYGNGMGHGMGHPFSGEEEKGLVAEISIVPGALSTAIVDNLEFDDLSDLAGRGVVICSEVEYGLDWKPVCKEPYFSCCTLKYDNTAASILN